MAFYLKQLKKYIKKKQIKIFCHSFALNTYYHCILFMYVFFCICLLIQKIKRKKNCSLKTACFFSQPFRPEDQFIYADADLKDYGPINYKAASIYAQMKKVKEQQKLQEIYDKEDML